MFYQSKELSRISSFMVFSSYFPYVFLKGLEFTAGVFGRFFPTEKFAHFFACLSLSSGRYVQRLTITGELMEETGVVLIESINVLWRG
jgi:hypothetical protein